MTHSIPSQVDRLTGLIDTVEAFCHEQQLPDAAAYAAKIATEEIVYNTILYGCPDGREATITLSITVTDDHLKMVIEDDALPFNPLRDAPDPTRNPGLPPQEAGGLGVFLVRELMDAADYEAKNGGNRLLLRKNLARKNP